MAPTRLRTRRENGSPDDLGGVDPPGRKPRILGTGAMTDLDATSTGQAVRIVRGTEQAGSGVPI